MTDKGLKLIMQFEGCCLNAYKCPAGVWTIGYGATHYLDGSSVKKGDKLKSEKEAVELLKNMVKTYEQYVEKYVTSQINPYQKDALTSFAYNLGASNLKVSTLLLKVNRNPDDVTIRDEFAKWIHSGGAVLQGLVRRRKAEADLYFSEWSEPLPEYNSNEPKGPFYPSDDSGKNNTSWMYQYNSGKK